MNFDLAWLGQASVPLDLFAGNKPQAGRGHMRQLAHRGIDEVGMDTTTIPSPYGWLLEYVASGPHILLGPALLKVFWEHQVAEPKLIGMLDQGGGGFRGKRE